MTSMPFMHNNYLKVEIPDFLKVEPLSACSTPGPSPSPAPSGMSFSAPPIRRPSRKSTLTQQQKNQKRQRATQDQLNTLEIEFSRNPTPAAVVRERIAQEINMTERSVQIWFQNRRAKIKNIAKKTIETGDDYEAIPESMRRYLAMQSLETGKPYMGSDMFSASNGAYGNALMPDATSSKTMIYHLACRSLNIGSWKRIGQTQLDLVVFYSPVKAMMTYYIQADGSGFRIEYPFSHIESLTLDNGDNISSEAGLIIKLNRPPIFTMDQGSGGWFQCRDFTEDQQASKVLTHHLGGHPKVLSGQLAKLVSLDSFQHRHNQMDLAAGMLGPDFVSPMIHRPSSQPNHLVHPRHQPAFATDGMFSMGPPPPRGHKRQRSRSVPVAVDFSALRQPITPFVMHQHQHFHTHLNNSHSRPPIFAPVPQHANQQMQHMSPLDASSGYNLDMPALSASGTSPPSDFDSSIMAGGGLPSDQYLQTPFSHALFPPIPESAQSSGVDSLLSETPISAQSTATPGHSDHNLLHLQTPCPIQRSASTSAIPQMLGGAGNEHFNLKSDFMNASMPFNMPGSEDMFDPLHSDSLLLQDDSFIYDAYASDPLADPFFDYASTDLFDTTSLGMGMGQMPSQQQQQQQQSMGMHNLNNMNNMPMPIAMPVPMNLPPTGLFTKRHCAKQSLTLPLRLNMMEQGSVAMAKMAKLSVNTPIGTPTVRVSPVVEGQKREFVVEQEDGEDVTEDEAGDDDDETVDYSHVTV